MNKKQYLEYIIPLVENYFAILKFSYQKSKGAFIRKDSEGWIKVIFGFYEFATTGNLELAFEVRKNLVEETCVKYIDITPPFGASISVQF